MYLYGASGHAKVIIDILKSTRIEIDGIFDDNENVKNLMNFKVLEKFNSSEINGKEIIISIGDNKLRKKLAERIRCNFGKAIHANALISEYCSIEAGTVVMQGAIIQAQAKIGKHVIINSSSIVEHDCEIENFVHLSPNATLCGNVKVGEGTHIGAGAIIIPGIKIGCWSVIGAGCVVIRDVPDNVVVVGNPGKIIKRN